MSDLGESRRQEGDSVLVVDRLVRKVRCIDCASPYLNHHQEYVKVSAPAVCDDCGRDIKAPNA